MNILLQGFSGCQIDVEPAGDGYEFIKSTTDANYGVRLLKQAEKQLAYAKLALPDAFLVPHIHHKAQNGNVTALHMDYIRGLDIVSYLSAASHDDIVWLQQALSSLVDFFHAKSPITQVPRAQILEKLSHTIERIAQANNALTPAIRASVEKLFASLPEQLSLPVGYCHGDLTLSNILVDPANNKLVLVDWLDSFIETPLMDMVKLRQDTVYAWSCAIYKAEYPNVRLRSIMQHMDKLLDDQFKQYPYYRDYYKYFQLLNLLRILPYMQNEPLIQKICTSIHMELTA